MEETVLHVRPLLDTGALPALLIAASPVPSARFGEYRREVENALLQTGGLVLRNLDIGSAQAFQAFVAGFGEALLPYDFASTPRSGAGSEGVYTATEYPAHATIPLHNEQSYTREWAMRLWFYCARPAATGGQTPIADSRRILAGIDPAVRERFSRRGLMYVRNYGNGLDLPWQRVFGTNDPEQVEAYCRPRGIACEWKPEGGLRTRQRCQATAVHPVTGEAVWFNQAHLFHLSALQEEIRGTLLDLVDEEDLPRNVYYGDGAAIADADLDHVRAVLAASAVSFPWQQGDVMLLDNMLCAHGRAPFTGPRQVLVAMTRPYRAVGEMAA